MNAFVAVLAFLTLPFSFTLLFPFNSNIFGDDRQEAQIESSEGEIKGAEREKNEAFVGENTFPVVFKPTKIENSANIALPNAHSAIILDVNSETILYNQNGFERRQIASLTKMMTAVLAMENIKNLDEEVKVDEDAVYVEGTKIGCPRSGYCIGQRLKVGEKVKAHDLMKAMLMNSANDAAVALAKHISGTEEEFVSLMNKKAKELNLNNSNFCTASGLETSGKESDCYSSAYDIARVSAYAMKYPLIWDIMRLPSNIKITSVDGTCSHDILNTDLVLNEIPNCIGGKTGFTPLAGRSLLLAASDETSKHKVVAVLLDDPYRWQDIRTMIDWTFRSHEWK